MTQAQSVHAARLRVVFLMQWIALLMTTIGCDKSAEQNDDASHPSLAGEAGAPFDGSTQADAGAPPSPASDSGQSGPETAVDAGASDASISGEAGADGGPNAPDTGATSADAGAMTSMGTPRLFYLDVLFGRVLSADITGQRSAPVIDGQSATPDGIAVSTRTGSIYWTQMGDPNANDGTITRAKLDGSDAMVIVPSGKTFTPKQLTLDEAAGKLYWSDREGMRVMRANVDGSQIETVVLIAEGEQARADARNWAVGIAIDPERHVVYWTQKGPDNGNKGSIRRVSLPDSGQVPVNNDDVEVLFEGLPEPIDLALDTENSRLFWSDRGDNTINSAPLEPPVGSTPSTRGDRSILVRGLFEAIGIALDLKRATLYYTDLGGTVGSSSVDGSNARPLYQAQGVLTGIAYAELEP